MVAFLRSLAATKGLAPEHVSTVKTYWEGNVAKSSRHCRAKSCRKIEGKEGWMHIVFCLDPVTLPHEPALEAAPPLQKGIRKHGSAPRGPLEREASKLLAQMWWKWSALLADWRLSVSRMAGGKNKGQGSDTWPGADE